MGLGFVVDIVFPWREIRDKAEYEDCRMGVAAYISRSFCLLYGEDLTDATISERVR